MKRTALLSLAAVGVIVVGYLDLLTGPDIGFSLFYLLPIFMTAWWWGMVPAIGIGVLASGTRFVAALAGRGEEMFSLVLWNSLSRLITFTTMAYVVARLQRQRRHLASQLHREENLARTDVLTGLPNWRGFEDQLRREISRSRRSSLPLCVGYVDLDNFKMVNDLHGHSAGDQCLKRFAVAIREAIRPEDLVARLGGDEFAILFNSSDPEGAEAIGHRLISLVRSIGEEYPGTNLGASVGIACFDSPPERADELIKQADELMYRAKRPGKISLEIERIPGPEPGTEY